jgi:gamma-glutamyltranspeptidase
VEVLLYIELAMVLTTSCQLEDIWGRCCFVLLDGTNSVEAAMADSAVMEVLAL